MKKLNQLKGLWSNRVGGFGGALALLACLASPGAGQPGPPGGRRTPEQPPPAGGCAGGGVETCPDCRLSLTWTNAVATAAVLTGHPEQPNWKLTRSPWLTVGDSPKYFGELTSLSAIKISLSAGQLDGRITKTHMVGNQQVAGLHPRVRLGVIFTDGATQCTAFQDIDY